jgi:hypothetical protein
MFRGHGRKDVLSLATKWRLVVSLDVPESINKLLYLQHPVSEFIESN